MYPRFLQAMGVFLLAVAAVGRGLSLVFIGYDFARGGRHFRVPDRADSE